MTVGVTEVVFLTGYRSEAVEEYFGDGTEMGLRIRYSREDTPLGRGGALKRGLKLIPEVTGPVLATNGDVITEADVGRLIADYKRRSSGNPAHAASILTAPMVSPYGIVDIDGYGKVRQFEEKTRFAIRDQRRDLRPGSRDQRYVARHGRS